MHQFNNPPRPRPLVRQRSPKTKQVGIYVYLYRCRMRLTQSDLARLAGTDRKTIYNIEKSKAVPSVIVAISIAQVLGVPVEEVFMIPREHPPRILR